MKPYNRNWILAISILGLVFVDRGFAAEVKVAIPKTQIAIQSREFEPIEKPAVPFRAEAFVSSFSANGFSLPSRVEDTSRFQRSGLPMSGLSVLTRSFANEGLGASCSARFGLSTLHMRRTARMSYLGTVGNFEQDAYIVPLEAGLVYSPQRFAVHFRALEMAPYFELSALPTAVFTSRSVMDDGESYGSFIGRGRAGAVFSLSQTPWAINAAVDRTQGSIRGSSLSQTSFTVGLRASLE